jgi:hypothetical protein
VHVDAVRDDLDTLILDADLLEAVLASADPSKKAKEISIKLDGRLRKHTGNPKFKALSERLEDLKNRHQQGLLLSIDFLKELLALAKDVAAAAAKSPKVDVAVCVPYPYLVPVAEALKGSKVGLGAQDAFWVNPANVVEVTILSRDGGLLER